MRLSKSNKNISFFDLLSALAQELVSGAELLAQITGATASERVALRDQLHSVEHNADEITHSIARQLNQTFVTPLDRDDLSFLASSLDDCMDYMDEAGDLIVLYNVEELPVNLGRQVEILQRCAELTAEAMPKVKTLEQLPDYWVEINRLENEADQIYRLILSELFDSGLDAITIIKLKDIIESLEKAADSFERLATVVETIAIKES